MGASQSTPNGPNGQGEKIFQSETSISVRSVISGLTL